MLLPNVIALLHQVEVNSSARKIDDLESNEISIFCYNENSLQTQESYSFRINQLMSIQLK